MRATASRSAGPVGADFMHVVSIRFATRPTGADLAASARAASLALGHAEHARMTLEDRLRRLRAEHLLERRLLASTRETRARGGRRLLQQPVVLGLRLLVGRGLRLVDRRLLLGELGIGLRLRERGLLGGGRPRSAAFIRAVRISRADSRSIAVPYFASSGDAATAASIAASGVGDIEPLRRAQAGPRDRASARPSRS